MNTKKKKQTKEEIIQVYYDKLESSHIKIIQEAVPTGYSYNMVVLNCFLLPNKTSLAGFSCSHGGRSENPKDRLYQYSLRSFNNTKPRAVRIPFLLSPNYDDKDYSVSHLCHNKWCLNPRHHVLEDIRVNIGRNGCPAGKSCGHTPRCIRMGPHSSGDGDLPHEFDNKVFILYLFFFFGFFERDR